MGTIIAIGGYVYENDSEEKIDTPLEIDQKILELSEKETPNVLFLPTASSDKEIYVRSIQNIYEVTLGANFDALLLHDVDLNKEDIKSKIEWADVIYIGGGNTLMMIKKWKHLGVDLLLKEAYATGKILCGVSAGSICWFDYGVSDSMQFYEENSNKYIRVSGLGFLKGVNCPHFGSELWDKGHRTAGMKEIMKRTKGVCYAIPDGAALVFKNDTITPIGVHDVKICKWEADEWLEEAISVD